MTLLNKRETPLLRELNKTHKEGLHNKAKLISNYILSHPGCIKRFSHTTFIFSDDITITLTISPEV